MSKAADAIAEIRSAFDRFLDVVTVVTERKEPQERLISLSIVEQQVDDLLKQQNATITDSNQHSWLQDIYSEDGQLYAVTVCNGELYRARIQMDGDTVASLDAAQRMEINSEQPSNMVITRALPPAENGQQMFLSVMCVTGINKMSLVDTRSLFDSFVEGFKGDGTEYVNLLHLGGAATRVGDILHLWRHDKLLVGIWRSLATPVAKAVAISLNADTEGKWGGSIEFEAFAGEPLTVAPGVTLETFREGNFLGYSIAPRDICASWNTSNQPLPKGKRMSHTQQRAISDDYRQILLDLLKDEALVGEVETMLATENEKAHDPVSLALRLRAVAAGDAGAGTDTGGGMGGDPTGSSPTIASLQDRMDAFMRDLQQMHMQIQQLSDDLAAAKQTPPPSPAPDPSTQPNPPASVATITLDTGDLEAQINNAINAAAEEIIQRVAALEEQVASAHEQTTAFENRFRALGVESEDAALQLRELMPAQPQVRSGVRPSQANGGQNAQPMTWKPTGLFGKQQPRHR